MPWPQPLPQSGRIGMASSSTCSLRWQEGGGAQGEQAWEIPWQQAAIEDVAAFEECLQLPADSFPRIRSGRALGEAAGVLGTPSVWLNGRLFAGRSLTDFRQAGRDLMLRGG